MSEKHEYISFMNDLINERTDNVNLSLIKLEDQLENKYLNILKLKSSSLSTDKEAQLLIKKIYLCEFELKLLYERKRKLMRMHYEKP